MMLLPGSLEHCRDLASCGTRWALRLGRAGCQGFVSHEDQVFAASPAGGGSGFGNTGVEKAGTERG